MKFTLSLLAVLFFSGCASTSDIDMTKIESECGQRCTASYSTCLQGFTLFPIQAQHQCTSSLKLCVQACPSRKSEPAEAKN